MVRVTAAVVSDGDKRHLQAAAYLMWLAANMACADALAAWRARSGERRREAFRAYRAALDREEIAALDLEDTFRAARG